MDDLNVEAVRARLKQRSEIGLVKYGVTTDQNGLPPLDWLQHVQDELLDAAVYIEQIKRLARRRPQDAAQRLPGEMTYD